MQQGENRALRAAEAAINNPLLDDVSLKGAKGILINITGGSDMTLFEVDQAAMRYASSMFHAPPRCLIRPWPFPLAHPSPCPFPTLSSLA